MSYWSYAAGRGGGPRLVAWFALMVLVATAASATAPSGSAAAVVAARTEGRLMKARGAKHKRTFELIMKTKHLIADLNPV